MLIGRHLLICSLFICFVFEAGLQPQNIYLSEGRDKSLSPAKRWELSKTEHFEIRFFPEDRLYADLVLKIAEDAYSKTKDAITDLEIPLIWVYITRTQEQFEEFKLLKVKPPDWAAGLAFPGSRFILLKSPASLRGRVAKDALLATFKHELAHLLLHQAAGEFGDKIPRWFDEGFATYQSDEWSFGRIKTLSFIGLSNSYIPFGNLTYDFPYDENKAAKAYAQSFSFVSYLYEKYGNDSVKAIIKEVRGGKSFPRAVRYILGKDLKDLESRWRRKARTYYTWIPLITSGTTLWFIAALVVAYGFIKRRRRYKEAIERWEEEELREFFH